MKETLKSISPIKYAVISYRVLKNKTGLFKRCAALLDFFADWKAYRTLPENRSFDTDVQDLYPRIFDKTGSTPLDPVYFYQDAWLGKKLFEARPESHVDIGSHAPTIGILSQFAPITMVDIRPLPVELPGLTFLKGTLEQLPFTDNSVQSLSSICVIEHIGLGRYGDTLDSFGSEKAAKELARILATNGKLYISVPVDSKSRVYFNAHRAFSRTHILSLFPNLTLLEEKYIYGNSLQDQYLPEKGFGTGLYLFTKR